MVESLRQFYNSIGAGGVLRRRGRHGMGGVEKPPPSIFSPRPSINTGANEQYQSALSFKAAGLNDSLRKSFSGNGMHTFQLVAFMSYVLGNVERIH